MQLVFLFLHTSVRQFHSHSLLFLDLFQILFPFLILSHSKERIDVHIVVFLTETFPFITVPPNGPVLFCSLASVVVCRLSSLSSVVVCNTAGWRAGLPPGGRAADTSRRASSVTSRLGGTLFEKWFSSQ